MAKSAPATAGVMYGNTPSFLDLTALPRVGALLFDPRPAWVWSAEGDRVLWANEAGLRFFGETGIGGMLQRRFSAANPSTQQIARLMRGLAPDRPRLEMLRFSVGVRSEARPVLCTRLSFGRGDRALLACSVDAASAGPIEDRARRLADALADGWVVAILAAERLVAASGGFESIPEGWATLAESGIAAREAGQRLVRGDRRFVTERRPVGLAFVTAPEGEFTLAMIGPPEPAPAAADRRPDDADEADRAPDVAIRSGAEERWQARFPEDGPGPVARRFMAAVRAAGGSVEDFPERKPQEQALPVGRDPLVVPEAAPSDGAEAEATGSGSAEQGGEAGRAPHMDDPAASHPLPAVPEGDGQPLEAEAEASAPSPGGGPVPQPATERISPDAAPGQPTAAAAGRGSPARFTFYPRPGPTRFVFQMDAELRFTFVSPEFAAAVGPRSATVVGEDWQTVAERFGLDPDGQVRRALERRDTWSGITVYWPVQEAELAVAVDLAALPAFTRERRFEGFRGFGVCRTGDTRPLAAPPGRSPPSEAGPGLPAEYPGAPQPAHETDETIAAPKEAAADGGGKASLSVSGVSEAAAGPAEPHASPHATEAGPRETPAAEAAAASAGQTNVVRLPTSARGTRLHPLSGIEEDAFRRIAEALRAVAPTRRAGDGEPPAAGEAGPHPPAPAAGEAARIGDGADQAAPAGPPREASPAEAAAQPDAPPVRSREPAASEPAERRPDRETAERRPDRETAEPALGPATSPSPSPPTDASDSGLQEPARLPAAVPLRILDRLPIGILVYRGRRVQFINRALLDLLGYRGVEEISAAGGIDALFGAGAPVAGSAGGPGPMTIRCRDGAAVEVEARLHTVPWQEEAALMLTIRSLPDKRPPEAGSADARERDFRQAQERIAELQSVLDTATDGVVVINADARIENLNRSAEALFGVDSADVVGTPFVELLAEESRKSALDYLDGLARNGVASVLNDGREVIGRVPQGGLIPLFMTMGRVGETGKFCAVLRDITHWKNAEEELIAARRAAEQANAQKSEFLAKISHEIRTPLNAVIGFAEVMLEERFGPIGSERYREYLRDIHLSGAHLMSLINDLLDLSKIEAGKLDLSFAAVQVNETIRECVALMQPQANRERIIIRTSLGGDVPRVVADPRSLRQIVLNLLSNAIKFTPAGGQVIVSSALEPRGEVVVRIRDTGIGMSEKDVEAALKPFRQIAASSRGRSDGTGLGLPLTKALVEANRASFTIDSTPNQGTLVRIVFPTTRVLAG